MNIQLPTLHYLKATICQCLTMFRIIARFAFEFLVLCDSILTAIQIIICAYI